MKPNKYRRIFTARRTSIIIFIAWFIASLVQLLYVATGHRYFFHPGKIFCNQDGSKLFCTILVSLFGAVQMIIISFCCFKVFRSVRTHNKRCSRDAAWSRVNVEDIKVSGILLIMVPWPMPGLLLASGRHRDNRFFHARFLLTKTSVLVFLRLQQRYQSLAKTIKI